jgi:hypothetical protein
MLEWTRAVVTVGPSVAQRVPGGYVFVEIRYTMSMPQFNIPMIFEDRMLVLGGPLELTAISRRSLD